MKPPCFQCEERSATCHSRCEAYREWKADRVEQLRQEKLERIRRDGIYMGYKKGRK